ncbi:MAG: shikimate kinase [Hungatella sp.]|nr:shikimate kinase [Hungatella sp.]
MNRIILIGFMGAGKTTVGKRLAKRLAIPFFDTDQLIEKQEGMTVSRIFEEFGEPRFRELETKLLQTRWTDQEQWVLSAGGGLPLRDENRKLLKQAGKVAYLRVQTDTVLRRLKGDTSRPLLQGEDVRGRVDALLSCRGPLYEEAADFVVDADGKSPEDILRELLRLTDTL